MLSSALALLGQDEDQFSAPLPEPLPPPPLTPEPEPMKRTPEEYCRIVCALHDEADRARKVTEMQWSINHGLYMNQYDFSRRSAWQHKGFISKISEMVDSKKASLKRMTVKIGGAYATMRPLGESQWERELAEAVTAAVRCTLDEVDFDDVIFPPQLIMAQLALMALKVYPEVDDDGRVKHRIQPVSPWNFFLDPLGMNKFTIHITRPDLSTFKQEALRKDSGFDHEVVRNIKEDYRDATKVNQEQYRDNLIPNSGSGRKLVELMEFFGSIDDPATGERLHTDVILTIANKRHLVRKPTKNTLPLKRPPFVWGSVRRLPFSVYSRPFVSDIAGLAKSYTDYFNMLMDVAVLFGNPTFEASLNMFEFPNEVLNGYTPGMFLWRKPGFSPDQPLIRALELGNPKADLFSFVLNFLDRLMGSHIAPSMELGLPTGGSATATETNVKNEAYQTFTSDEVAELEAQVLEPLYETIASNLIYYQRNYRSDPRFRFALTKKQLDILESLTEDERVNLAQNVRFKARGLSDMFNAEEASNAIDTMVQRVGRMFKGVPPEITMPMMWRINWDGMLATLAQNAGVPSDVVVRSEEDAMTYMEKNQQMLARMMFLQQMSQMEVQSALQQAQQQQMMQQPQPELPDAAAEAQMMQGGPAAMPQLMEGAPEEMMQSAQGQPY